MGIVLWGLLCEGCCVRVGVTLYIQDVLESLGKDHGLILMNHHHELDWLYGWMVGDRARLLGNCRWATGLNRSHQRENCKINRKTKLLLYFAHI